VNESESKLRAHSVEELNLLSNRRFQTKPWVPGE
jgi:hypothetical protein